MSELGHPSFLGLKGVGWKAMTGSWWERTLAIILLVTLVMGIAYILYLISIKLMTILRAKRKRAGVPASITKHFDELKKYSKPAAPLDSKRMQVQVGGATLEKKKKELKSFGVYLGSFARVPTPSQSRLLSQWDVLALDPLADGVPAALSAISTTSSHVLARLDVVQITRADSAKSNKEVTQAVDSLLHVITAVCLRPDSRFTGVLVAGSTAFFHPLVLNKLVDHVNALGLDVWLEISYPDFISAEAGDQINFHSIRGVVYRNATIRTDGLQQNVHQMEALRVAQRAIARQKVVHGPPMVCWETVEHGAHLDYAVCQRTFSWCRYNSALSWIGRSSALYDADLAAENTVPRPPLGALMWLKDEDNMKAHDTWRLNNDISATPHHDHDELYRSLDGFVPDLANKLRTTVSSEKMAVVPTISKSLDSEGHHWSEELADIFSLSANGESFTGLGCFNLGLEASFGDFAELVLAQREYRDLDLLRKLTTEEMTETKAEIQALCDSRLVADMPATTYQALKDLLHLVDLSLTNNDSDRLNVHIGLHSGFQNSAKVQFWGLYDIEPVTGAVTIFLSKFTPHLAGTILHTFLSSRGIDRTECLLTELAMSRANGKMDERWQLPPRLVHDVQRLSPEETLLFLRRLVDVEGDDFVERLRVLAKNQLIDGPTLLQLRALGADEFLDGKVSSRELVTARLLWLAAKGVACPGTEAAIALFDEVKASLYHVLMAGESETYAQISTVIQTMCKPGQIDASVDIFALAVFKAFQQFSLDEVYLEVMDRLVYPNHAQDQAGVFAELFALGSRCESFFDATARVVGVIISNRYREYYMQYQPPRRPDVFTELPTAYAGMQRDDDPTEGITDTPFHYKLTFLGIFAVPALIDITLLTTIGRGLYLTTFMTSTEKTTATTALLFALVSCGAVGGWISSGGSYYLFANAFPAMNMFVLTRFVVGLAVVLVGGIAGLIAFAVVKSSIVAGLIFFFYFGMLAIYLMTLSALSIYQVPGSNFLSGRTVIMSRIPILFISPIITIWVGHDIIVYVVVLTFFLATLLLGARDVMAEWSTWYLNIPTVTDGEIIKWYIATSGTQLTADELGMSTLPRQTLLAAVMKESKRSAFAKWRRPLSDPLVAKLAAGYESTKFLMIWYCRFKRSNVPLAYSSSWNLTLKAGLEGMTNMQKGLKLHSAFLHWRHTGSDIPSAILYFVVALLDKWAALFSGGALVGLSAASSAEFRLSVGFGLCYYLIGAVSLDTVSQPLWTAANEKTMQPISSIGFLRQITANDKAARRVLYWQNFFKFIFLHIWGMVITSAMMWFFTNNNRTTIMFVAYLGAYSGLLWYQYNKIYCGFDASRALIAAAVIGLPIGIALHIQLPTFAYSGVVSLAIGTWIACIYSLWLSDIGWPNPFASKKDVTDNSSAFAQDSDKDSFVSYSSSVLSLDKEYSDATMEKKYLSMVSVHPDKTLRLNPTSGPGLQVMKVFNVQSRSEQPVLVRRAFSNAPELVQKTADLWAHGTITVDVISSKSGQLSTSACKRGDQVHVAISLGIDHSEITFQHEAHRYYDIIAEVIMQASAEHCLGLSHDDSIMAQVLVTRSTQDGIMPIPESVKFQMETSAADRSRTFQRSEQTYLHHLLLKVRSETEWDALPLGVRSYLVAKCCAEQVEMTEEQKDWILSRNNGTERLTADEFVARCDGQVHLTLAIKSLIGKTVGADLEATVPEPSWEELAADGVYSSYIDPGVDDIPKMSTFQRGITRLGQRFHTCLKFLVLPLTADLEYQRELDFTMKDAPPVLRVPVTYLLNSLWYMCKFLQSLVLPAVLFHKRPHISSLYSNMKNMKTVIEKGRTVIDSLSGTSTCFITPGLDGASSVSQYSGNHQSEPAELKDLMAVNNYAAGMVLTKRQVYKKQSLSSEYVYDYPTGFHTRLPLQRRCIQGAREGEVVQYDERGYITTGSYMEGVNKVNFTYWYRKDARFEDELLRGEYVFPHITIRVNWSMPPRKHIDRLDEWVPHATVTEATFIEGANIHHTSWGFDHKFETDMSTTLNGEFVPTPDFVTEDWFHILDKPKNCAFLSDNPFLGFSSMSSNFLSRALRQNTQRYAVPTSQARIQLWKAWRSRRDIDAVTARWLDETLLRDDSTLKPYWRMRDMGRLTAATAYIEAQADTIMARVDLDPETSSWVHIAFKIADLYSFGLGGDTTINTRTVGTQLRDTNEELHVLAMDTSTFPMEPGGVSACRRDLVNDLKTIKWHLMAESANDYGVPRFQIERNIQSLTLLPLWGLDFLNPTHGLMVNSLDSAIVERSQSTNPEDIKKNFLPILTSLVRVARKRQYKMCDIEEATRALVDLNTYFESTRNWNDVWSSPVVKQAWRELWLVEQDGTLNVQDWWDYERPTMMQMDLALNMWTRYLFIFSIAVPEKIPDVFQASHHFTGATYGILCKVKRNCTLHVWDHCISFREFTTFMSSAVSFDNPFVNSSLISLGHMSCVLLEHHADVVLPCAAYFNPGWEVELGTSNGGLEHRKTFARKIDPVVNGICNMEKFEPIQKIKTSKPTVVMLSHIQFVKDIKNAIMATDLIVNKWGFKDYELHIYGDMERAAGQAVECQELIASKNLRDNCILKGLGRPDVALQDAWLFLNSSISEGLPLAMGEAALTGVPVVCTDVGASFCVVTDAETGERFSEVVAPNDSESLARAQISVMACIGQWSSFGEDAPGAQVPVLEYPNPTPESVAAINSRMIEKQEQRRKLGMMGRTNVLKNFSADRYLREHEQMLWIGKYSSTSYRQRRRTPGAWPQRSIPQSSASSVWGFPTEQWQNKGNVTTSVRDSGFATPLRTPRLSPQTWDALSSKSASPSTTSFSLWDRISNRSSRLGYPRHTPALSVGSSSAPDEELGIPMVPQLPAKGYQTPRSAPMSSANSSSATSLYQMGTRTPPTPDEHYDSRLKSKFHEAVGLAGLGLGLGGVSKRPGYQRPGTAANSPLGTPQSELPSPRLA